jgi:serine protease Do
MRTYSILLIGLLVLLGPALNAQTSNRNQRETIVIKRSGTGPTTIELSFDGLYVNGERVATRQEVNNRNLAKRIIVEDGDLNSGRGDSRSYDDYYNSGRPSDTRRAILGVYSGPNRSNNGAYIQSITANSAAERGGLRAGDFITRVDTANIYTAEDLTRAISRYYPGDRVTVSYSRGGRERQTTVTLMEGPSQGWSRIYESPEPWANPAPRSGTMDDEDLMSDKPRLGVSVEDMADGRGVRILSVRPNSPAENAGIRIDDVVTSIDGFRVNNVDDLQRIVGRLKQGNKVNLSILRNGDRMNKLVTMPKPRDVRDF